MASAPVERQQFELSDHGITHTPTGYTFTAYPGDPSSGTVNRGRLGDTLQSGEDYRPYEVEAMARELWADYMNYGRSIFRPPDLRRSGWRLGPS